MGLQSSLSALAWNIDAASRGLRRYWRDLERFQALRPPEARRELAARLLAQLKHFGSRGDALPEWREAASIRHPDEVWALWSALPILTKQDLRERFQPAEMMRRFGLRGRCGRTGGSTGEPTPYLHDAGMVGATSAASRYCRMKMGWHPGLATICVWGSERDIGKSMSARGRWQLWLRNEHLVDGYCLDWSTVERILELVRRHRPVALYGFTSMLEFAARELVSRGSLPPPHSVRVAWNGGEMLSPQQSALFKQAFGVPVLNLYGGRELSAMAYQPGEGASLVVLRPLLFLEIVDEQGKPVAPGEVGRLVWTSTVCRGSPFLRYDIGDAGAYAAAEADESGIRALKELHGRYAGLLRLPDGRVISNLYWNHLFKEFPEVRQFQVALLSGGRIELRLAGCGFTPARELQLRRCLQPVTSGVEVRVEWMERIPLTPQGKLIQVVREE